jgi:hypothetical protein
MHIDIGREAEYGAPRTSLEEIGGDHLFRK